MEPQCPHSVTVPILWRCWLRSRGHIVEGRLPSTVLKPRAYWGRGRFFAQQVGSALTLCTYVQSCFLISWGGVRLSLLSTSATNWPIAPAPNDDDCGAVGGMRIGRGNRSCPPQISHDLTWARTRAAAVGSLLLIAWAVAHVPCQNVFGLKFRTLMACMRFSWSFQSVQKNTRGIPWYGFWPLPITSLSVHYSWYRAYLLKR
jgi:hypothetical protein